MSPNKSKLSLVSKLCVLSLLVFSSLSVSAQGQSFRTKYQAKSSRAKVGVSLEPIWLLVGGIGGKAEYFISDKVSVGFGGVYIPKHKMESSSDDKDSASIVGGEYNWEHNEMMIGSNVMLTGTLRTNGFYLNPAIGYQNTAISEYSVLDYSGSVSSPFLRITAGYQWITAKNFRVAVGAGSIMHQESDIIVADNRGREVHREKMATNGGLALDLHVGYIF